MLHMLHIISILICEDILLYVYTHTVGTVYVIGVDVLRCVAALHCIKNNDLAMRGMCSMDALHA
jgi:hypothetical protein